MEDLRHIAWRCRRGALELDLMLQRFLQSGYSKLSSEQKQAFSELLDQQDPLLLEWLMGRSVPDNKKQADVINKIREQS